MTIAPPEAPAVRSRVRTLVDVGPAAAAHGLPFPVLLTHAAYGDAVRWERADVDESEPARLEALLSAVAAQRQHLYRHPNHRHIATLHRRLNRAPSGILCRGVLPTPTHLSVELGEDSDGDPVIVVGLLS